MGGIDYILLIVDNSAGGRNFLSALLIVRADQHLTLQNCLFRLPDFVTGPWEQDIAGMDSYQGSVCSQLGLCVFESA